MQRTSELPEIFAPRLKALKRTGNWQVPFEFSKDPASKLSIFGGALPIYSRDLPISQRNSINSTVSGTSNSSNVCNISVSISSFESNKSIVSKSPEILDFRKRDEKMSFSRMQNFSVEPKNKFRASKPKNESPKLEKSRKARFYSPYKKNVNKISQIGKSLKIKFAEQVNQLIN
jgi:hypothetical protein